MVPKEAAARAIAIRLRQQGHAALLAGGCVRDRLLGRTPQDYDVATSAPTSVVQACFPHTVPVGVQFGVILVVLDGEAIEVATFRTDEEYVDGRRPRGVRFGTPEEDARRRDFTINGMFLDPETDEVIDHVGGLVDLKAGILRGIGDPRERIAEDRLRMLRAVRFAAGLGFRIEPETMTAIRAAAPSVTDIAWERIGDEIERMLTESPDGRARQAFELLDESGLLAAVLPEIRAMQGVGQSPDHHPEGDVFEHTLRLLAQLEQPTPSLAFAALLHDVGKPPTAVREGSRVTFHGHETIGAAMAVTILQRLRRSRTLWETVEGLVRDHLRHRQVPAMRLATLKRFLGREGIDELLELVRMDCLAGSGDLSTWEICRQRLGEWRAEGPTPPPLLRGRDLLAAGLVPGPRLGTILEAARDAQFEGAFSSPEEALRWARQQFGF